MAICYAKLGVRLSCWLSAIPACSLASQTRRWFTSSLLCGSCCTFCCCSSTRCLVSQAQNKASATRETSRKAFWNSVLLKIVQLLSRKVERDPALKDEKQPQGQPGEKKYCLSLMFLGESFPLRLTQHRALLHSRNISQLTPVTAQDKTCSVCRAPSWLSTVTLAKQLCWGVRWLWAWPWHPSASKHLAKSRWHLAVRDCVGSAD